MGQAGTPQGMAYLSYILTPKLAIAGHIGTDAALRFAKKMVGSGNAPAQVAGLTRLERMAQETASQIKSYSKAIFQNTGTIAGAYAGLKPSDNNPEVFNERKKSISKDANDPQAFLDKLDKNTQLIHQIAPKITGALQQSVSAAVQFLNSKLPQDPPPKPFAKPLPPNKSDIDTFNKYYDTIQNPVSVLKTIRDGTTTHEHVEALQAVTPKLYGEMQTEILNEMTNKEEGYDLPYHSKMALSLFLGQDLDDSLEQPIMAQNQSAMAMQQAADNAAGAVKTTQAGLSKLTKSKDFMTPMQATAHREA